MMYTEFEAGKIYRCIVSEARDMMVGTIIFVVEVLTTRPCISPFSNYRNRSGANICYYDLHETVYSHDKHGYRQVTEVVACDVDSMATNKPETMVLRNARWVICESE